MKRFLLCTAVLLLSFQGFTAPADAQADEENPFTFGNEEDGQPEEDAPKSPVNQYDKKYRPVSGIQLSRDGSIVSNADVQAVFIHAPSASPDDVTLRVTIGKGVTGCLLKEDPSISVVKANNTLKIMIDGGDVMADQFTVRYAHYECDVKTGISSADLTFSKEDLLNDKISEMVFINKSIGLLLRMKLEISPEKIMIVSSSGISSYLAKKNTGSSATGNAAEFWFYPENTLILSAPGAKSDAENIVRLKTLARAEGLVPLEEIFSGFVPSGANTDKVYAVDDKNLFASKLPDDQSGLTLGEIEISEPFYGPQGATERTIRKQVFVRKPNLYE